MNQTDTIQYIPFCLPDSAELENAHPDTAVFSLDSILAHLEHPEVREVPSIFRNHTLQVVDSTPQPKPDMTAPTWIFVTIVAVIVGLCVYFRVHSLDMKTLFQAIFNHRAMERILRENNLNHMSVLAPIALVWGADISLLIYYLACRYGGFDLSGLASWQLLLGYLVLVVAVTGLFHLRNTFFRLLGHTFEEGATSATFITSNYLFTLLEATATIPLMLVLFYGQELSAAFMFVIIGVVALLFFVRVFRGIKLFLTLANSSYLHLFYYLCIVEFGPILVLLKVVNIL